MAEQRGFQQVGGSEPLFTGTNRRSERGELVWMALAISSLPVPVSPVIRMVERLLATCPTRSGRQAPSPAMTTLSWEAGVLSGV